MNSSTGGDSSKRPKSTSYSQSVKDGDAEKAYTPAWETQLSSKSFNMDLENGEKPVLTWSRNLFAKLLKTKRKVIVPSIFPQEAQSRLLNSRRNRNESLVNRDVTSLISPPILTTASDLSIGLPASTFTKVEIDKLNSYSSVDNWTRVTDNMYFPFFMCEVKCGRDGLDMADRQAMHSGSVALRGILRLVQEADRHRLNKKLTSLSGRTLVFSISHDQRDLRIHGHFVMIQGDKWTYHRCSVKSFHILTNEGDLLAA